MCVCSLPGSRLSLVARFGIRFFGRGLEAHFGVGIDERLSWGIDGLVFGGSSLLRRTRT